MAKRLMKHLIQEFRSWLSSLQPLVEAFLFGNVIKPSEVLVSSSKTIIMNL